MITLRTFAEIESAIFSILIIIRCYHVRLNYYSYYKALIRGLICNILMLIAENASYVFNGDPSVIGWWGIRITIFWSFALQYLMIVFMAQYLYHLVGREQSRLVNHWLYTTYLLVGVCFVGLILNPAMEWYYVIDSSNTYLPQPLFVVEILVSLAATMTTIVMTLRGGRHLLLGQKLVVVGYFIFPIIGGILQILYSNVEYVTIGMAISIIFLYMVFEWEANEFKKRETLALFQSRAYLLNSQIKPHFLFNAMSVIQYLIGRDPKLATEAIGHLADYLRKGLSLKSVEATIPVKEELDYVDHYLYIEQLRFGDKLKVKRQIEEDLDFRIPFLTIQPLVENAVRHGIRQKVDGGTVLIRVFTEGKYHVIEVVDDGAGMDLNARQSGRKNTEKRPEDAGIGLDNVEERIHILCEGYMEINSIPGKGTKVSVKIPVTAEGIDGKGGSRFAFFAGR